MQKLRLIGNEIYPQYLDFLILVCIPRSCISFCLDIYCSKRDPRPKSRTMRNADRYHYLNLTLLLFHWVFDARSTRTSWAGPGVRAVCVCVCACMIASGRIRRLPSEDSIVDLAQWAILKCITFFFFHLFLFFRSFLLLINIFLDLTLSVIPTAHL